MKKLLGTLGWIAKLAIFLLVLGFALKNSQTVSVESYLGYSWQAPLIVLLLIAFLLGALTGLLALLPYLFRLRRRASRPAPLPQPQIIATDIINT
jgi:putative membrane protein